MIKEKDYDLVISDINMPVMDGLQFALQAQQYFENRNNFFASKNNHQLTDQTPFMVACSA